MENNTPKLVTAQDFYDFFSAIPEEQWTQDTLTGRRSVKGKKIKCHCANYWLGVRAVPGRDLSSLNLVDHNGDYGVYSQLENQNLINLGKVLNIKLIYKNPSFGDYITLIVDINDNIGHAIEFFGLSEDKNLLDLTPKQKGKLAKHNILKALQTIIDNEQH